MTAIFPHVIGGVDQRFFFGSREIIFTGWHDDLAARAAVEQVHGPQPIGASLDVNGERLYFNQARVSARLHGGSVTRACLVRRESYVSLDRNRDF